MNNPKKKLTNKILIPCLIALVALIAVGIWAWSAFSADGDVIVIHRGDEIVEEIDLSDVDKSYTVDLGTNTVLIEKDGATVTKAKCPDKICVHTGKITKNGEAIICAPNKIMIEFKGNDKEVDAVAGGR